LAVNANAALSRDRAGSGASTAGQTSTGVGASLSWELDLWGRVRESKNAAQHRLLASTADADAARLSIIGEIADTALALRACNLTLEIRDRDIASRQAELTITRARLAFGNVAPVVVATVSSNLASAQTDRITQLETCQRLVNAQVALSGLEASAIRQLFPQNASATSPAAAGEADVDTQMPEPPAFAPALPATVLLGHPMVIAAEREVAARWSEIGVARADQLPRIDLTAVLTQQWIRAAGTTASYLGRSAEAGLTAPLFDGGAGAANVRGAQARYREALARLDFTVRAAVRNIEDALAAQQSAVGRKETSAEALRSAQFTLNANVARLRVGAIAQLELEESRRQFNRAQENAIAAAADGARAWVALVRQTGAPWDAISTVPSASVKLSEGGGQP
jgi:outer membrane protein TolC